LDTPSYIKKDHGKQRLMFPSRYIVAKQVPRLPPPTSQFTILLSHTALFICPLSWPEVTIK